MIHTNTCPNPEPDEYAQAYEFTDTHRDVDSNTYTYADVNHDANGGLVRHSPHLLPHRCLRRILYRFPASAILRALP